MTGLGPQDTVAEAFEAHRGRLVGMAYRMLGSRADAEDAVQEAWLRLARQDTASITNLAGWLTTVVGRECIDVLRRRKAKPETPYDDQLPELVVTLEDGGAPEDDAVLADSVGLALLMVLETLSPSARLAFVLHDLFAVPYEEIAQILGKSVDATKMLASRARRKLQGTPQPAEDRADQRAVVDAFLAAARTGDFEGLLRVLDPDVTWRVHTARGVVVRLGATAIATKAQHGHNTRLTARNVRVNGAPGVIAWDEKGRVRTVMACTVVNGRITEMVSLTDPARLAKLDLPDPPA
ncbi:sigma-70 family RNA polymerase sigma factor [Kribbella sp. CA-293567]|uniref:sigma-70 family RNA polymerase sigma factor n=1 Tax=Kribbella sp. CA-293567 TaxID=3002436 RepID=UPI0022DDAC55|nr:sigma-70 family RNA polymerase sigma factor [Kribbella sp. CA-293567]WBQ03218.1 sigma-70 family RNA polymerase sigma factor [Kribbella sp. CA-293567]